MSSIDMERFREDINRYRNKTGMPWAALAEKAGVSPAMFTRIKKGSAVTLEAFANCAPHSNSIPSTTCRNSKQNQRRNNQWKT